MDFSIKTPLGPLHRYIAYELNEFLDARDLSKTFAVNLLQNIAPLKPTL